MEQRILKVVGVCVLGRGQGKGSSRTCQLAGQLSGDGLAGCTFEGYNRESFVGGEGESSRMTRWPVAHQRQKQDSERQ